ncbi:SRPBCC family protein [Desmospora profundinema]|uniref:Uncharacterized protein YndB with AHSA1/START domain n=1 Tax=Desmospora profundinema TaxID=1571184 RepID=A0ABU1IQH4_9BACL|nr:SRPBCC family protein [Desmospora profundinema]MDR6226000.1 uncharacterized protein YndB with AHSA1/START domain [Desmospora profundinema]
MKGTLHEINGRYALTFERFFSRPVEKVWHGITDPDCFNQWYPFSTGEMDLRVGGKFHLDDGEGSIYEGIITELDPPNIFAFREVDDWLRFELRSKGDGCLLRFTHTFDDRSMAARTAAGWHGCLEVLDMVVDGKPAVWPDNMAEWREKYAKEFNQKG